MIREPQPERQRELVAVLDRARATFERRRGVHHVDVGIRFVAGRPTDELAVRVHVVRKVPAGRLAADARLPAGFDGAPVDVLATNPRPHRAAAAPSRDARADPLVGGVTVVNPVRSFGFGTLGAVVFDRRTGDPMVLSNSHILVALDGAVGDRIAQPDSGDDDAVIGTLARWDDGLDCAVALLDGSRRFSTAIVDYPAGVVALGDPVIGTPVTKSGRTTGTTFGIIDGVGHDGFTVVPDPERPAPGAEISSDGDSGAIWLDAGRPSVGIGLHVGGESDPAPEAERAWATSLTAVARELDIRFRPADGDRAVDDA